MSSLTDEEWMTTTIGELAEVNPPKPKYLELDDDSAVGFVPMAAVDEVSGSVTELEERRLGELRQKSYRTFATGDVIFAKITPCMENGKSAIVPDLPNGQGFGSTEFHVLRPRSEVEARYIWRYLRQPAYRAEAEAHMTGSVGQMRVPPGFVRDSEIRIPVREDLQRQVVDHLDAIDRHASAAQEHIERSQQLLEQFRRALLASACSGRLSEDLRTGSESGDDRWVTDLLRPGTGIVKPEQQVEAAGLTSEAQIQLLPSSWRLVRLGDIFDVATGATPLRKNRAYFDHGSIPWVASGAVNAGVIVEPTELITELAIEETNAKPFPVGTLLVAMYGEGQTRGRVAELGIEAATNQAVAAILFSSANAELRDYLRIFFEDSYQRMRALSFGGVQQNLSLGLIKRTLVPLPPSEERAALVGRVQRGLAAYATAVKQLSLSTLKVERARSMATSDVLRGDFEVAADRDDSVGTRPPGGQRSTVT